MNIAGTQYNLEYEALEIYVAGCNIHCEGCHNKQLWDFNVGKPYETILKRIEEKVHEPIVKRVWILGGEPLDQNVNELIDFMNNLDTAKECWLWTGYPMDKIPDDVLACFDVVKSGAYRQGDEGYVDERHHIRLASKNQTIQRAWDYEYK